MALFASLDIEKKVQVNDKTRLTGKRSFVTKGATALTTMTIKPGDDASAISVFDADNDLRFLDWQFSTFDIDVNATNNKLNFNEGGSELTATLATATYTLAGLAAEIKAQLDAAGALVYTVAVSDDEKVTISAPTAFSLLPETGTNRLVSILPIIKINPKPGFGDNDFADKTSITGKRVRELPKTITIVIGDGSTTDTITKTIQVLNVVGDALFSSDKDLVFHRHNVLDFLPEGRNSFLHVHRRAQDLILAFLDENGHVDIDGDPLTLAAVTDAEEFRQWSTFVTLRIIHDELSNDPEDDFFAKASGFKAQERVHRKRAILRVDNDNDGKADIGEGVSILGGSVRRR